MEEVNERFAYFVIQADGNIVFTEKGKDTDEFILPRHPDTNDLDIYYLQSMLKYFDPSKDVSENEILDAFPVISQTKDRDNKFYKLSFYRLREFYKDRVEEDAYIQASFKHLFMYDVLAKPTNKVLKRIIQGCLNKISPIMYHREEGNTVDTVDYKSYHLEHLASYVPTKTYRIMKLLKGWIEGALHFYDYSIMFFDYRFVGFDDFAENIIDLKTKDLFPASKRPQDKNIFPPIYSPGQFKLNEYEMYYEIELQTNDIFRKWLFTPPTNDNERDGKVMMFRNREFRERLEEILTCLFKEGDFRLNDVFKWNRYSKGGKFNSHYDTMFVQSSSAECSLYTFLIYISVEGETFMYLSGEREYEVKLQSNMAYIIPHWVKHRVEGRDAREFIKTEIVFKNKFLDTIYDQTLADAFDASCYYMLQTVRHPELKNIVSQNFNTINEARFYKSVYPKLIDKIYFIKSVSKMRLEYYRYNDLLESTDLKINYITDGTYYYFKTKNILQAGKPVISRNEALVILCIMQLDVQPKKMYKRYVEECQCEHSCTDYSYIYLDFDIHEEIVHWQTSELDSKMSAALQYMEYPSRVERITKVGNISISDMPDDPDIFYFAACQNVHPCKQYNEWLITNLTSGEGGEKYSNLKVDYIGDQKNIVKIRQHSFKNGLVIKRGWEISKGSLRVL